MSKFTLSHRQCRRAMPLILFLCLVLPAVAFVYSFALTGSLQFDDESNLSGLSNVTNIETGIEFTLTGGAGPLGRPIALATFALQANSWPNPPNFLYVNICIHLLNGILVAWLAYLLSVTQDRRKTSSRWVAIGVAGIWLSLPLLLSSSLMIVQRMTTLSASFVLAGTITHLILRRNGLNSPRRQLLKLSLSLTLWTALATLTKENGVLLPVYIAAIEAMCTKPPQFMRSSQWDTWRKICLTLPLVALIAYLLYQLPYPESTLTLRQFSGSERLLHEPIILIQYVIRAFFPTPSTLGPFEDGWIYEIYNFELYGTLALTFWALLLFVLLKFRGKHPNILFGVLWFLGGHLLESTTIPLEFYFEHRNYLPLIGPIYAIVSSIERIRDSRHRTLGACGIAAYVSILLGVTLSQTSLWGNPRLASEMWANYHPTSARATMHLLQTLERDGETSPLSPVADEFLKQNPGAHVVRLQKLIYDCLYDENSYTKVTPETFHNLTHGVNFTIVASKVPEKLFELKTLGYCQSMTLNDIENIALVLLEVPSIASSPISGHNIYVALALVSIREGNYLQAQEWMNKALDANFNFDTLEVAVKIARQLNSEEDVRKLLTRAENYRPDGLVRRIIWQRQLAKLTTTLQSQYQ